MRWVLLGILFAFSTSLAQDRIVNLAAGYNARTSYNFRGNNAIGPLYQGAEGRILEIVQLNTKNKTGNLYNYGLRVELSNVPQSKREFDRKGGIWVKYFSNKKDFSFYSIDKDANKKPLKDFSFEANAIKVISRGVVAYASTNPNSTEFALTEDFNYRIVKETDKHYGIVQDGAIRYLPKATIGVHALLVQEITETVQKITEAPKVCPPETQSEPSRPPIPQDRSPLVARNPTPDNSQLPPNPTVPEPAVAKNPKYWFFDEAKIKNESILDGIRDLLRKMNIEVTINGSKTTENGITFLERRLGSERDELIRKSTESIVRGIIRGELKAQNPEITEAEIRQQLPGLVKERMKQKKWVDREAYRASVTSGLGRLREAFQQHVRKLPLEEGRLAGALWTAYLEARTLTQQDKKLPGGTRRNPQGRAEMAAVMNTLEERMKLKGTTLLHQAFRYRQFAAYDAADPNWVKLLVRADDSALDRATQTFVEWNAGQFQIDPRLGTHYVAASAYPGYPSSHWAKKGTKVDKPWIIPPPPPQPPKKIFLKQHVFINDVRW